MKGGAVFIEQMFHIDLHLALLIFTLIVAAYVITGGIKGVLYTDALQAVIMFACMLFLLFWFYHIMDMGFIEANQKLTDIAPWCPSASRPWDIKDGQLCPSQALHNGIHWLPH